MTTHQHQHHQQNAAHSGCNHGAGEKPSVVAASEFIDPVCGMTVKADSPYHASHDGRDYRFCSAGCRTKFVAEPDRYLAAASAEPEALPAGTTYTCPMHPEIVRDAPGTADLRHGTRAGHAQPRRWRESGTDRLQAPILVGAAVVDPVLVVAMFGHRLGGMSPTVRTWIELVLTTPVVLWAGWPFFQRWAQSIANRSPNMWTLIGTGVGAAFIYSVVATLAPGLFPARSTITVVLPCTSRPPRSSSRSR